MGGMGGEIEFYRICRNFLERVVTEQQARSSLHRLGDFYNNEAQLLRLFDALKNGQSDDPYKVFRHRVDDGDNEKEPYILKYNHQPLDLLAYCARTLGFRDNEADALLTFRLFHRGGGNRDVPKLAVDDMARVSCLTEAPLQLMLPQRDIGARSMSTPWFDFAAPIREVNKFSYNDAPALVIGKVALTKLAIVVGINLIKLSDYTQLSIYVPQGVDAWTIDWKRVLIDVASEHTSFVYPAIFTEAHEYFTTNKICRLAWGGSKSVPDKLLVRMYSRIFSGRTRLVSIYDHNGKEILREYHPLHHQKEIVTAMHTLRW